MNYPDELKKGTWLKKKGLVKLFDKTPILAKTDLGADLAALEVKFNGVGWSTLRANDHYDSLDTLKADEKGFEHDYKCLESFTEELKKVEHRAEEVQKAYKNHSAVPQGVTAYVGQVASKCRELKATIDKNYAKGELWATYRKARLAFEPKAGMIGANRT